IAKYQYPDASRALVWEGEIKPSEMAFRGSYAEVAPNQGNVKDVLSTVLNHGLDHHWIIGRGHIRQDLLELHHWLDVSNILMNNSNPYLYGHSTRT
ncbi:MAG: fucose isomerase, partial [Bacteroidota bacterium]